MKDVADGKPLPEPVEVIEVTNKSTNPFLQDILEQQKQSQGDSSDDESRECLLSPEEGEADVPVQRNPCELLDIDNKFTPFKPKHKSKEEQEELPKMKVFLPKGDADDDSDCSSVSSAHQQ